jgi:hypothetical protein
MTNASGKASSERQQMSRRKQPEMPAPVPAATARHRVLVPPGGAIPVTPPLFPVTRLAVTLRISVFSLRTPWGRTDSRSRTRYWGVASRI